MLEQADRGVLPKVEIALTGGQHSHRLFRSYVLRLHHPVISTVMGGRKVKNKKKKKEIRCTPI